METKSFTREDASNQIKAIELAKNMREFFIKEGIDPIASMVGCSAYMAICGAITNMDSKGFKSLLSITLRQFYDAKEEI